MALLKVSLTRREIAGTKRLVDGLHAPASPVPGKVEIDATTFARVARFFARAEFQDHAGTPGQVAVRAGSGSAGSLEVVEDAKGQTDPADRNAAPAPAARPEPQPSRDRAGVPELPPFR